MRGNLVWELQAFGSDGTRLAGAGPHSILAAPGKAGEPEIIAATLPPNPGLLQIVPGGPCLRPGSSIRDLFCGRNAWMHPHRNAHPTNRGAVVCSKIISSAIGNSTPGCHFNTRAQARQKM
ncbi:MAG TPA: hypothetical protein VLZ89_12360 [Anaerolineales bacterium]|nr:hypothetical protein [Anaerolineales bacterium]